MSMSNELSVNKLSDYIFSTCQLYIAIGPCTLDNRKSYTTIILYITMYIFKNVWI
jgi:hypothetical protein